MKENMRSDEIQTTNKVRLIWIDIIKGLCMFFIVMSHSKPPLLYTWFYTPFFLSGFFFVSGFTFSGRNSFRRFLIHKAKTLLIPYWSFGLINAILAFIADGDSIFERIKGLLFSINQKNDDLWFVMCLFTMEILFYLLWRVELNKNVSINKVLKSIIASIILSASGFWIIEVVKIQLPFQIETALIMIPFMLMGYLWKQNIKIPKNLIGGGTACLLLLYLTIVIISKNTVNIHAEQYHNFPIFMISAIVGTSMIAFLSMLIEKVFGNARLSRWLVFVGQNTLVYYAFQSKVIRLLDVIYNKLSFYMNDYLRNPLYALVCCAILVFPAILINKYFPFLLGRNIECKHKYI